MTTFTLFERASRANLVFGTTRGTLEVSDLWRLALCDLNTIAVSINEALTAETGATFLTKPTTSKTSILLTLKLDVLKRLIEVREEEEAAAVQATEKAIKKRKLLKVLANKRDEDLQTMTEAEILAELETL